MLLVRSDPFRKFLCIFGIDQRKESLHALLAGIPLGIQLLHFLLIYLMLAVLL